MVIVMLLYCFAGIVSSGTGLPGDDIVFPGEHWEIRKPEQVGLDSAKLDEFAKSVGGSGCIIRDGYMIYSWGDIKSKLDWASAMKPVMSTMLFFAVHEGKLSSVDALVNLYVEKVYGRSLNNKDQTMTCVIWLT